MIALAPAVAPGCGGSSGSDAGGGTPDGGTAPSICGTAGQKTGTQCSGLSDCGGASNLVIVQSCQHCFARADTQVCEAGTCRMLPGGSATNLSVTFTLPAAGAGALSFTIATLDPIAADGTSVTCAALLTTCRYENDAMLNAVASRFRKLGAPADPSMAYTEPLIPAEPGSGRLVYIALTSDDQGKGTVMAKGCTEGIMVPANMTTQIAVTLQ
jgi:hypothetical protein